MIDPFIYITKVALVFYVLLACTNAHGQIRTLPFPTLTGTMAKELCPHGADGSIVETKPTGAILACVDIERDRICKPGFSKTIRPPLAATEAIKKQMMAAQGIPIKDIHKWRLDHITPLELDGAPLDPNNLQLQPIAEASAKDKLERAVTKEYCAGRIELPAARARFSRGEK